MKRAMLSAAAFILIAVALPAQTIVGTWQGRLPIAATGQGSLPGSGNPRIVFTIEKIPNGSFHCEMTWIDRGTSRPLNSVTFTAPDVTFAESSAAPKYRGKLSADGKSISGTWTQGIQSFPLTLQLATADTLWKSKGPEALPAIAAHADPSFEVATIKPAPDKAHALFNLHARRFKATGTSAKELIKIAYNVRGRQVLGGPPGLEDKKYDIVGEPDTPGMPSEDQNRAMVHKLLTERFHLVSHTEEQIFQVLALTLDPKGPRPTPSEPGFNGSGGGMSGRRDGDDTVLQFSGTTIREFLAFVMNTFQDKQLVDETGLIGTYDITLRLAIPQGRPVSSEA